jgi:hypothetical protein
MLEKDFNKTVAGKKNTYTTTRLARYAAGSKTSAGIRKTAAVEATTRQIMAQYHAAFLGEKVSRPIALKRGFFAGETEQVRVFKLNQSVIISWGKGVFC